MSVFVDVEGVGDVLVPADADQDIQEALGEMYAASGTHRERRFFNFEYTSPDGDTQVLDGLKGTLRDVRILACDERVFMRYIGPQLAREELRKVGIHVTKDHSVWGAVQKAVGQGRAGLARLKLLGAAGAVLMPHSCLRLGMQLMKALAACQCRGVADELVMYCRDVVGDYDLCGTVLEMAAHHGKVDVMGYLLRTQKASADRQDEFGATALMAAAEENQTDAVRYLLSAGAYVNLVNRRGESALLLAAKACAGNALMALIEGGAQVDSRDKNGCTALLCAAALDSVDTVRVLLRHGAAPGHADHAGRTPLWRAAGHGSVVLVGLLIDSGAPLDAADEAGATPLHCAVSKNRPDNVEALLRRGASATVRNHAGDTPQDLARRGQHLHRKLLRVLGVLDDGPDNHRTKHADPVPVGSP
eukprot:TRINITY_DN834_c0_g1_i2.p1 TRINITY_DN834_c0_g1~~TRINITY_DN834_c0_g1_i2.p1  ORF type:complete len:417 (+),score=97.05 TRINITY_DN834_c0_g1_i2:39-1289(+)